MYFDALYTATDIGNADDAFYHVISFEAESLEVATRKAKAKKSYRTLTHPSAHYRLRLWSIAPSGTFDNFIGKNVGDFIEAALCQD